jgi:hypothetical protein
MRHLIDEPFALRSPAIEAGHLGGGAGLIDEDKSLRVKGLLLFPQGAAGRRDVGPVLFGGVHALFLALRGKKWVKGGASCQSSPIKSMIFEVFTELEICHVLRHEKAA